MSTSTAKAANGQATAESDKAAKTETTDTKAASSSQSADAKAAESKTAETKGTEKSQAGGLVVKGKANQIQPYATPLPNGRPIFPCTFEYVDSDNLPGARPIALSTFKTFALLPGDRPIMASNFKAVAMLSESRPIMARSFDYVDSDQLPGGRPIALHTFEYDEDNLLPGGRPIAKNHSEEIKVLIGYLD